MSGSVARRRRTQQRTRWVEGATAWTIQLAGLVALVTAGYLLYGLLAGRLLQFATQADAWQAWRAVHLAGNILLVSVVVLLVALVVRYWREEAAGYLMALSGGAITFGLPYALAAFEVQVTSAHAAAAMRQLGHAGLAALLAGAPLIVLDLIRRLQDGLSGQRTSRQKLVYGGEVRPQQSIAPRFLGKCWQMSFCRPFIRDKCPVFIEKKACWRERIGCMCEDSIVSNAVLAGGQVIPKGQLLDVRYSLASLQAESDRRRPLTEAQKAERCRNCIIYNERQRQKYKLLAPLIFPLVIAPVVVYHEALRGLIQGGIVRIDRLMAAFAFQSVDPNAPGRLSQQFAATTVAEWVLLGCLTLAVISYLLRATEWAIFKIKI